MMDPNPIIAEYLLSITFFHCILHAITTSVAMIANIKVIVLALSVAIKINQIIMVNTWNSISKGCSTETFSFAYAILLKG